MKETNTDLITRDFTIESFRRSVNKCDDVSKLREWNHRLFELFLKERDISMQMSKTSRQAIDISLRCQRYAFNFFVLGCILGICITLIVL